MAARPYWSGRIRIALVSLSIDVYTAVRRGANVPLHELDRATGERIRHLNVNEEGAPVEYGDIVKAFEVEKDSYVTVEKDEIEAIRLPSSDTLELGDFVPVAEIPPMHFERPYYVLPSGKDDADIYAVLAEALRATGRAGIGQITLRGREELCAVMAWDKGLILETLRYESELQDIDAFFGPLAAGKLKNDYVALARQLVDKNTHPVDIGRFHDHYHEALLELIEAKRAHRKPHFAKAPAKPAKVIDFMDALQRSLSGDAPKTAARGRAHAPHRARRSG